MITCSICDYEFEDSLIGCPRHNYSGDDGHELADKSDGQALIGATVRGLYRVGEIIGKGAMGIVYRAVQLKDGKEVALKVLHTHLASDPESIKRFRYEARAASSLMHANIVRIYDVEVSENGQPYIAMELLDGITLSQFMKERGCFSAREALPIIRQTCEALAEAHSRGVLHRDIKPANIMLCNRFGVENFVIVLDFSIAKIIQKVSDVDSTTPGLIFGSPTYMSPERFMGRGGDFRSDIYSTAIIMFQMLAGRAPFKSANLYTLMNEHLHAPPPHVKDIRPDADLPDSLEETIARALAKKPEDRQENIKQLLAEVDYIYRTILDTREEVNSGEQPQLVMANVENYNVLDATVGVSSQRSPNAPLPTFGALSGQRGIEKTPNYAFEIDPTMGAGSSVHGASNPANSSAYAGSGRKPPTQEESIRQKLAPEYGSSGRWDKSLIATKNAGSNSVTMDQLPPVQRQRIRPTTSPPRLPLELLAIGAVLLVGLCAIGFCKSNAGEEQTKAIEHKIDAGDLDRAEEYLRTWHDSLRDADTDAFGDMCVRVSKAFAGKQNYKTAEAIMQMVPDKAKCSSEAKALLKSWHAKSGL